MVDLRSGVLSTWWIIGRWIRALGYLALSVMVDPGSGVFSVCLIMGGWARALGYVAFSVIMDWVVDRGSGPPRVWENLRHRTY